jgi:sugar/nucleoside kinase (ribokinase family)
VVGGRDLAVLGVGDAAVDIYLEVDHIPGPDQKVMARNVDRHPGGMVANFLVAFRRLGLPCGFNGVVGDDELGRQTLDDLAANGVDLDAAIVRPGGTTYFCVILLDASREKALVVAPTDCLWPQPDDVSEAAVRRARHVHTTNGNIGTAIRATALAKRHGLSVSLDVEAAAETDELRHLLGEVDLLFVGPEAARASTDVHDLEEATDQLLRMGPRVVCLTMGAAGSLVATSAGQVRAPAYAVPVVDSTGAGDCFAAAFVHGYLSRWPLDQAARFASAAGALAVTRTGGHGGAPTMDELTSFIGETR